MELEERSEDSHHHSQFRICINAQNILEIKIKYNASFILNV